MTTQHTPIPFIRTLLANKSEEHIKEAEQRFLALIDLARRVHTRLQREQEEQHLTSLPKSD
jgi:hypothetical protein